MAGSTATGEAPVRGVRGLANQANPAFAAGVVAVPVLALVATLASNDLRALMFVHVMAGVLWTGIDLMMGLVLGPTLGSMAVDRRASFFRTFTPKMTFLMPTLALVTITGGIVLAQRLGKFPNSAPWLALMTAGTLVPVVLLIAWQFGALRDRRTYVALVVVGAVSVAGLALTLPAFAMTTTWTAVAIAIVTLLSWVGFGVILPGEIRIYRQLVSAEPDEDLIATIGMRNAKLGGVQGVMQLAIIFVMVGLRWV